MSRQITSEVLREKIASYVRADAGKSADRGTLWDYWTALSHTMVELMADDWEETRDVYDTVRQTHYFSAEFLVGRSMLNNLVNLGIYEEAREAIALVLEIESAEEVRAVLRQFLVGGA